MSHRVKVIVWHDLLVLCDDGRSDVADYDELFEVATEFHQRFPQGWGLITIIPTNAVPPGDEVRSAINEVLLKVHESLRAASWCIEGKGFQSAMARAVLTGFRYLTTSSYPRNISTSLKDSVSWVLPQLPNGNVRVVRVDQAVSFIDAQRQPRGRALDATPEPMVVRAK
jgi:hypothetical protein